MMNTVLPKHIVSMLEKITSHGFDAYVVGGSVRNTIMNRPPGDWDITTSAKPDDIINIFDNTVPTGEKYGTITVLLPEGKVEVTTFRIDGEYFNARHPESVEYVSDLKEDLSRRDFTINAIAMSLDGNLIDPHEGIDDIKAGIIRCVGDPVKRFTEDALRMFRAFRFSAQHGFKIEKSTLSAIKNRVEPGAEISAERIRAELEKILMSQKPEVIGEIIKAGLLDRFLSGTIKNSIGLSRLSKLQDETILRWGVLCAVLLDEKCIESALTFLRELRLDNKTIKIVHVALSIPEFPADRIGQKRLLARHGPSVVRLAAAVNDIRTGDTVSSFVTVYSIIASKECFSLNTLAVTGRDLISLGLTPGPGLGEKLQELLEHVIINPADNKREILLDIIKTENNT